LQPPVERDPDCLVACLRPWSAAHHFLPVGSRRPETPAWFAAEAARALDAASGALDLPVHFVALQRDRDPPLHEEVARQMRATVCASESAATTTPSMSSSAVEIQSAARAQVDR